MPKLLSSPETLVQQASVQVNRKDLLSYTVDSPLSGGLVVRRTVLARFIDPETSLPIDEQRYDAPALVGASVMALAANAGVRVVLRTLQLLNLPDTATIADLVAALNDVGAAGAGQAYYEGTRDALYDTV